MSSPVVLRVSGAGRPPLVRPRAGRMLGGVARGVADHLGLRLEFVRLALLLSVPLGGFGIVVYLWVWALAPASREPGSDAAPPWGTPPAPASSFGDQWREIVDWCRALGARPLLDSLFVPGVLAATQTAPAPAAAPPVTAPEPPPAAAAPMRRPEAPGRSATRRGDLLAGVLLVLAGAVLLASRQGWAAEPGVVLPLLVVGAGAIIAYAQLDEVERARWAARTGAGTRAAVLRVVGGLVLVVLGVLLLVVQRSDVAELGRTLLAALAVLAGAALVLAPWAVRLWRDLDTERAGRVRESARADIAAHLHDSVLQTLALIQRRANDPAEVARLARSQERDLRGWIYGAPTDDPTTLAASVAAIAAEAEDVHGAVVEVVTVGDRPVDGRTQALLAALREAVFNAARHAGAPVQVYVESGPDGVEAGVKDRGRGFVLSQVPEDRLGVRESVIGRMERHGGSARVTSAPGEGTDVRLLLPNESEVHP